LFIEETDLFLYAKLLHILRFTKSKKDILMPTKKAEANSIDKYLAGFPESTQKLLERIRATIRKAAPGAEEIISYRMPAYKYHGMLVYFAGHKNHIGFYPTASGIKNFEKEISVYKNSKGSIQFPFDKPLPVKLITKIVLFRIKENEEKAAAKVKTKNK